MATMFGVFVDEDDAKHPAIYWLPHKNYINYVLLLNIVRAYATIVILSHCN